MIQWFDLVFFAGLTAVICGSISLMFLPALLELKKPKDAGPRVIDEYSEKIGLQALNNLDEEKPASASSFVDKMFFSSSFKNVEDAT